VLSISEEDAYPRLELGNREGEVKNKEIRKDTQPLSGNHRWRIEQEDLSVQIK